jgi:hypothetical protein
MREKWPEKKNEKEGINPTHPQSSLVNINPGEDVHVR